ncbi:OmpA family protein [Aestuariispira insulae]|uniref:OmpA family protein n=1 Tax=Aestuariispira insulae TaxID=1461337 RepID=A0A3D9H6K0_9PROT|nr:OmpA family protein [Aestuariispira insulae]RED45092.1 OmpA family protein [Aestuariispira insulae]
MTVKFSVPAITLTAMLLAGCANTFESVKENPPAGDSFARSLHAGYIELAEWERAEYDWMDGSNFTDRAAMATAGNIPNPEEIAARNLPGDKVGELTDARARLMAALDDGARTKAPKTAAHAQVMFDCWMQEQEENRQPEDIDNCRGAFLAAMDRLDEIMAPKPMAEPAPMEEPEELPTDITVFFAFNSSELMGASNYIIAEAADVFKNMGVSRIVLSGHADKSGADDYNAKLAERRLAAVKAALVAKGVPANSIDTRSYGEKQPAVATDDGVKEPQNRRVDFLFIK